MPKKNTNTTEHDNGIAFDEIRALWIEVADAARKKAVYSASKGFVVDARRCAMLAEAAYWQAVGEDESISLKHLP